MTVRDAKFVDIPRLTSLMAEAHQRSIYADTAIFDPTEARQLFARSLQRHGHQNYTGCLVLVSEKNGIAEGFIIGFLDQVYPCLDKLMATDLLFILSERADPMDAPKMLRQVETWAAANPKVIKVHLGVTSAIGDWQRTAKLYERLGFEQVGAMLEKRIER